MPHRKPSLLVATATTTLVMAITAGVGPITLFWTNETRLERNVVELQVESIRNVQSLLVDAETGERGYALTEKDEFLEPYFVALSQFPLAIKTLRRVYKQDTPEEIEAVELLISSAERELQHLAQVVHVMNQQGSAEAKAIIADGKGKAMMDTIREISAGLISDEIDELAELDRMLLNNLRWAVAISGITFFISIVLGRFIYISMREAVRRQSESAIQAIKTSGQLSKSLVDLERRSAEIALLAEMARLLQAELSQTETLKLASTYCEQLLPDSAGEFYLYRNSTDALELASTWGRSDVADHFLMNPKDCWALRRGRWHVATHKNDLCCAHYPASLGEELTDLCMPLSAYGEVLGLFHVRHRVSHNQTQSSLQVAEAIVEQTALALANANMRVVLRNQSVQDPLTSLYNRRFMDETLKRELARSERNKSSVSVVMLDMDNFKHINDTFGHSAGDAVLRAVATLLTKSLRESDIACRFGGEELILVLPDCPMEAAASRAEAIRASVEAMNLAHHGQNLRVTASFGVASTLTSGTDQAKLLRDADAALYAAKRFGKNRVERWLSDSM